MVVLGLLALLASVCVPALARTKPASNAYRCQNPSDPPSAAYIVDRPGNYHNRGCDFSFADGHSEIHKWKSPSVGDVLNSWNSYGQLSGPLAAVIGANDPQAWIDTHWLADVSTVHK